MIVFIHLEFCPWGLPRLILVFLILWRIIRKHIYLFFYQFFFREWVFLTYLRINLLLPILNTASLFDRLWATHFFLSSVLLNLRQQTAIILNWGHIIIPRGGKIIWVFRILWTPNFSNSTLLTVIRLIRYRFIFVRKIWIEWITVRFKELSWMLVLDYCFEVRETYSHLVKSLVYQIVAEAVYKVLNY